MFLHSKIMKTCMLEAENSKYFAEYAYICNRQNAD